MRALVVVNPAATSTTAKMRDVLVRRPRQRAQARRRPDHPPRARPRARRPGGRRGHRRRGVRRWRRNGERGRQRPAGERSRRRTCRCSPWCPAGRRTSSPARSAAPATRSRRPRRSSTRCGRAGRGWSPSAPRARRAAAPPRSAAPTRRRRPRRPTTDAARHDEEWTAAALVRLRRRARLRRRGHRPRRGPAGAGTPVHRRPLRQGGDQRLPARPGAPPAGHDAAAARASRPWRSCSSAWSPT